MRWRLILTDKVKKIDSNLGEALRQYSSSGLLEDHLGVVAYGLAMQLFLRGYLRFARRLLRSAASKFEHAGFVDGLIRLAEIERLTGNPHGSLEILNACVISEKYDDADKCDILLHSSIAYTELSEEHKALNCIRSLLEILEGDTEMPPVFRVRLLLESAKIERRIGSKRKSRLIFAGATKEAKDSSSESTPLFLSFYYG